MQEATQGGNWSDRVRRRLSRSIVLSAILLAAALSFVRITFDSLPVPLREPVIEVTLPLPRDSEPEEIAPTDPPVDEPEEDEAKPLASEVDEVRATEEAVPSDNEVETDVTEPMPAVDWYAELERVSAELAASEGEPDSVNPHFEELRRVARLRYGKPQNDPPRPIWENVETDYLGRKILRDGDCFRIIDDPSVGNRYVFENFQQYMVYCTYQPSKPRDLPWVKEIQSRYGYLRRDDEYLVPQECTDCENR